MKNTSDMLQGNPSSHCLVGWFLARFRITVFGLVWILVLGFTGCDFQAAEDAFNDFDVIVALEDIDTFVALSIVDASTDQLITGESDLYFDGAEAGAIVDMFSDPIESLKLTGGLGSFGITNARTPSSLQPVEFRVLATAAGYRSGSATVRLTRSGQTSIRIYLLRTDGTAAAAVAAPTSSASVSAGGVVTDGLALETGRSLSTASTASVTIEPGTVARSSSGDAAKQFIRADLALYPGNTSSVSRYFPGGLNTSVRTLSGEDIPAALTTAGFINVSVSDSRGTEINRFDRPVDITIGISSETVNQEKSRIVAAGDKIEVFSFEEENGVWKHEGDAIVQRADGGSDLSVRFTAPHLSFWSVGWQAETCSTGSFVINRNGNGGRVDVHAFSEASGWAGDFEIPESSDSVVLDRIPAAIDDLVIDFTGFETRRLYVSGSPCGSRGSVEFNPPSSSRRDVTFGLDFGPSCTALRLTELPAFILLYGRAGTTERVLVDSGVTFSSDNLGRITGGSLVITNMIVGETYTFYTSVNGEVASRDLLISSDDMLLDVSTDIERADICAN